MSDPLRQQEQFGSSFDFTNSFFNNTWWDFFNPLQDPQAGWPYPVYSSSCWNGMMGSENLFPGNNQDYTATVDEDSAYFYQYQDDQETSAQIFQEENTPQKTHGTHSAKKSKAIDTDKPNIAVQEVSEASTSSPAKTASQDNLKATAERAAYLREKLMAASLTRKAMSTPADTKPNIGGVPTHEEVSSSKSLSPNNHSPALSAATAPTSKPKSTPLTKPIAKTKLTSNPELALTGKDANKGIDAGGAQEGKTPTPLSYTHSSSTAATNPGRTQANAIAQSVAKALEAAANDLGQNKGQKKPGTDALAMASNKITPATTERPQTTVTEQSNKTKVQKQPETSGGLSKAPRSKYLPEEGEVTDDFKAVSVPSFLSVELTALLPTVQISSALKTKDQQKTSAAAPPPRKDAFSAHNQSKQNKEGSRRVSADYYRPPVGLEAIQNRRETMVAEHEQRKTTFTDDQGQPLLDQPHGTLKPFSHITCGAVKHLPGYRDEPMMSSSQNPGPIPTDGQGSVPPGRHLHEGGWNKEKEDYLKLTGYYDKSETEMKTFLARRREMADIQEQQKQLAKKQEKLLQQENDAAQQHAGHAHSQSAYVLPPARHPLLTPSKREHSPDDDINDQSKVHRTNTSDLRLSRHASHQLGRPLEDRITYDDRRQRPADDLIRRQRPYHEDSDTERRGFMDHPRGYRRENDRGREHRMPYRGHYR